MQAITDQTTELIDWLSISAIVFENKFSPRECIFEFLKLPISQSLAHNIESSQPQSTPIPSGQLDQSKGLQGEYPEFGATSIFNDAGNPLLSQVAIFARLLEQK